MGDVKLLPCPFCGRVPSRPFYGLRDANPFFAHLSALQSGAEPGDGEVKP